MTPEICTHCGQAIGSAADYTSLRIYNHTLLLAVQQAYLKHQCNDDRIGWDELGEILLNALTNVMGDEGYQKWIREATE